LIAIPVLPARATDAAGSIGWCTTEPGLSSERPGFFRAPTAANQGTKPADESGGPAPVWSFVPELNPN